jgi:hypothetical protein
MIDSQTWMYARQVFAQIWLSEDMGRKYSEVQEQFDKWMRGEAVLHSEIPRPIETYVPPVSSKHKFVPYPKGSVLGGAGRCSRCGMPESSMIHE